MTHPHAPPDPSPSDAAFLRTFFAVVGGLLLLIGVMSWLVDPLGAFGTGLLPPVVTADRDQKATLYHRLQPSPRLVVLGSSRSKTLDPGCLTQLTGLPAFNFAVNGAGAEDFLAILRFLRSEGEAPRRILVGVDPEVLQGGTGERRALAASRSLAPYIDPPTVADRVATLGGDLFGWQAVSGGLRSLLAALGPAAGPPETVLEADGVQRFPLAESRIGLESFDQDGRVRRSIPGVLRRYEAFPALDSTRVRDLTQFFEQARAAGVAVTAFIPPVHPALAREAEATAWAPRTRETVELLRRLESGGFLEYRETRNLVAASPDTTQFVDAVHFLAPVARRLAQAVVGAPAACAF